MTFCPVTCQTLLTNTCLITADDLGQGKGKCCTEEVCGRKQSPTVSSHSLTDIFKNSVINLGAKLYESFKIILKT